MTRAAQLLKKVHEAGLAMKMPNLAGMSATSKGPKVSMPKLSTTSSSMPKMSSTQLKMPTKM
jgi:hypothetical protein